VLDPPASIRVPRCGAGAVTDGMIALSIVILGGNLTGYAESLMKYRVLIEQDEDGFFVAEVPALPGCISQGGTREEALASIREAIAGYLESLNEHQEPIPPSIHEEIVEV
jgi:predicted RNase H-like HicB family nuclease